MFKTLFFFFVTLVLASNLQAINSVEAFLEDKFELQPNYLYTLAEVNVEADEYKAKAKQEALEALSSQIYTQVTSDKTMLSSYSNDEAQSSFTQNVYVATSLPIHGAKEIGHLRKGFSYFLLMALDTEKAAPLYKEKANELSKQVDTLYSHFLNAKTLLKKTDLIEKISDKYSTYEKNAMVATLFGASGVKTPKLDSLTLKNEREKLLSVKATSEEELAILVTKKLSLEGFKDLVKVYPLSYQNKGMFSPFSDSFKNYLVNSLSNVINLSHADNVKYAIKGNYFLKKNTLEANIFLEDDKGAIKKNVIAKLELGSSNKNSENDDYYIGLPKKSDTQTEAAKDQTSLTGKKTEEEILWEGIRGVNHIDGYTYYLKEYPEGKYVALARFEIEMQKNKKTAQQSYGLLIATYPTDATVKILNIVPKYKYGMKLQEGSYHIEVSKEGYKTTDKWIQLDRDTSTVITLKKLQNYQADLAKLLKQKPLAQTYYNQKKYKQAFEIYQPLADLDDTKAQNMLGIMYQNGYYVKKSLEKAAYWYRRAADNGYTWGQSNLAWMYNHGQGVAKDYKLGMYWYNKAAEQENASAMNGIGWMYEKGWGVPKDTAMAIKWYERAVKENSEGSSTAKKNLARLKIEVGVKPKKADLQTLLQQKPLARTYYKQKKYKQAFEIYQPLAELGDTFSQNRLGIMYQKGYYVKENQTKAVYWYRKAAEQGFRTGQYNLGIMYKNGKGVARDYKLALYWFNKAAAQGHSSSMNLIGKMYEEGQGVTKNRDTAIQWYEKAMQQNSGKGSEYARKNLARLKKEPVTKQLNVSGTWHTSWKNMYLTQDGNKVSGKYDYHDGKVTGQLKNNRLEGYWYQPDSGKKCGPSNAWSGKIVFAFDEAGKSFKGDWSYCNKSLSSLNPSNAKWNGKR